MVFNIRQKQSEAVQKLLNLNTALNPNKDPGEQYKVLVLDRFSRDIIAPLFRLNDLRRHGVTLHLSLEADRQAIPDVPAIYLVQPLPQHVDRIVSDAAAGLYETMHLNFTTSLPSRLLEQMAVGAVRAGASQRVAKVYDQYLSFVALEPTLFTLGLPNAYVELNDPAAKDSQIEAAVQSVVDGLFSVCVTLGVVPLIRCPCGGAAEHVAGQLDQKLRDALKARNNLFAEGMLGLSASLSRPLLCLFDRNYDLAAALQQPWTYKPMVHDVLAMHLNRIQLAPELSATGPIASTTAAKRAFDVDDRDFFWETCGAYPFPKVAEEVETQLQRYRAAVEEINKRTAAGAQEGVFVDQDELLRRNTQHLMAAVSSLPELQEQKKTLDKHTNLATALLAAIKARGLDAWHNAAEDVLCGKADLAAVMRLVGGQRGSPADRLRLALIWLLTTEGLPSEVDLGDLEAALRSAGADVTALAYVRTLKRNNLTGARVDGQSSTGGLSSAQGGAALLDWADKTFGQGLSHVTKSVKTLLAGSRQPPVVSALEALMDGKAGSPEYEGYAVFDPKAPAGRCTVERCKGPFKDCIVFMLGGGNYLEREQLMAWAARNTNASVAAGLGSTGTAGRNLLYGTTEVLSGEQFVAQLVELGKRSGVSAATPAGPTQ